MIEYLRFSKNQYSKENTFYYKKLQNNNITLVQLSFIVEIYIYYQQQKKIYILNQETQAEMSSDMQGYKKISEKYKEIVQKITTQECSQLKLYFVNLSKQIASGQDKFLTEFNNIKDLLDNIKEAKGKLPIHYATATGNIDIVKYMLQELKVDYQLKDKQGNNSFFTAIQHGHFILVKYFVQELGVSPFSVKDGQIGVLHIAANRNNIQLLEYFINRGCDIEKISIYGKPINWAAGSRHIQATKFLLQKGADANGDTTCTTPPPLILAVDFQCQQLYQLLLNAPKPANINVKDPQGYSLLHLAAQKGNLKLVKELIQKGLQVNMQVEGKTALALAFQNSKWEVVSYLRTFTKNHQQILQKLKQQKQKKQKESVPVDKAKAQQIKLQGNKFFVESNYAPALQKYKQAIIYDPQNDAIHRNLAACYLHLKNYQQALLHCHKAKIADPKNVKNLYRQAQAYIGLGNLVDAASSLWECAMLEPQTIFFKQQFVKYVQLAKQQQKKQ